MNIKQAEERFAACGTRTPRCERSGPSWEQFLTRHRIVAITDTGARSWRVASQSGSTYTVTLRDKRGNGMSLGPSMYLECNCPARGGKCRHRVAVLDMLMAEAIAARDYDRADWLERIEQP